MPLQCTACGYPASQTLTCAECGGHAFQPSTTPPDRRWWALLIGVLLLQTAHAAAYLVHNTTRYYAIVTKSAGAPDRSGVRSDSAWSIFTAYVSSGDLFVYSTLCASLLGGLLIVLAICMRKRRFVYTVAAVVACAQYPVVLIAHYIGLMVIR